MHHGFFGLVLFVAVVLLLAVAIGEKKS